MSNNLDDIKDIERMDSPNWNSINPEYVQRMRLQNQFKSGIDIAKYTSSIMRKDMDASISFLIIDEVYFAISIPDLN